MREGDIRAGNEVIFQLLVSQQKAPSHYLPPPAFLPEQRCFLSLCPEPALSPPRLLFQAASHLRELGLQLMTEMTHFPNRQGHFTSLPSPTPSPLPANDKRGWSTALQLQGTKQPELPWKQLGGGRASRRFSTWHWSPWLVLKPETTVSGASQSSSVAPLPCPSPGTLFSELFTLF